MYAVDERQRSSFAREMADFGDVRTSPNEIGCRSDRDQLGTSVQLLSEARDVQLSGRRVEINPASNHLRAFRRLQPRTDVGVVIEPTHEYLVPRSPTLRKCAREVVGQLRHGTAKDNAGGRRAEKI